MSNRSRRRSVQHSAFILGAMSVAAVANAESPNPRVTGETAKPIATAVDPSVRAGAAPAGTEKRWALTQPTWSTLPLTSAPRFAAARTLVASLTAGPRVLAQAAVPATPAPAAPAPAAPPPGAASPPPSPETGAGPSPTDSSAPVDPSLGTGDPGAGTGLPTGAGAGTDYVTGEPDVVTVTIDRRSRNIQNVSGSAQAFDESDLERKGIVSIRELTAATPYLEVGSAEGNIEIYMRGIGNSNNTEIGDPAAAFHIDGIYIPRPRGLGSMFYDLERVEVLRGPQGTLRGRNATAGTMNVISAQPKLGTWAANGSFQLGNYNQRLTKAMVNVPLGDTAAFRFAMFDEKRDPFYVNANGNPELRAPEDADNLSYRASVKWEPSSKFSAIVRFDSTRERGTGWVGSNFTQALNNGILPEEIPNVRSITLVGHQPAQSLDHWGISAALNFAFGPVNLEVVNSYRYLKYTQNTGTTNGVNYNGKLPGSLDRYDTSIWDTRSQSIVNEIRLYSPDTSRFRWTVGGFNLYESQFVFLGQLADNNFGYAGAEYNHPDIKAGAVAGYADGTLDITQVLRVLGGVRVTHDYKHRNGVGYGFNYSCGPDAPAGCANGPDRFGTEGFQFAGKDRTIYAGNTGLPGFLNGIKQFGARDTLLQRLNQPGIVPPQVTEQHGSTQSTFVDFRFGGEFNVSPRNLLYATFSTGHKAGGFNDTLNIAGVTSAPEFGPEAVNATELGSKNQFLNKKVTLNVAAFWYDYRNYQASSIESYGAGEAAFRTSVRKNVGTARILGLDIDGNAKLPAGFTLRLAGALLDARFLGIDVADTRVSYDPTQQPIVNLKGKFLPRAPTVAASYGIEQVIPTSAGTFDWSLSGQTKAKMFMTQFNGDGKDYAGNVNPLFSDVVPWTHRFDASVGYVRPKGDIHLEAFISNMTNMTYMTSIISAPGYNSRFYNTPRQFGLRASFAL